MIMLRPATQADQGAISTMVRAAKLNPVNLRWANFWVAEAEGRVVGAAQLRPYTDGSRELASLVVDSVYQHQGVGGRLVSQLLTLCPAPIYLFCEDGLGSYYVRFGFHGVGREVLPPPLARLYMAGRLVTRIGAFLSRQEGRLIAMRWDGAV
jgi:N-acetylglutamate synthase-like GNAT family acetyltransferase